jgi:FKBP-type peptidyl-prolyl cis-trans isomerase FklB
LIWRGADIGQRYPNHAISRPARIHHSRGFFILPATPAKFLNKTRFYCLRHGQRAASMIKIFHSFMKLNLPKAAIAATLVAFSTMADEPRPATKVPDAPDKEKLSYALGMTLGMQIKRSGVEPKMDVLSKAIRDVLEDRPTEISEGEIRLILKQGEAEGRVKQSSKYIAEGADFLVKNAKAPGVQAFPDGVQYKVIKTGTGELAKHSDVLTLKFKGTWIDGAEFNHNDNLEVPFVGCTKGLQEALLQMKVGSRWMVFIPYNLAYGRVGERATRFGSTLIYDIELLNAEPENAHPNQHHSNGRVGHSLDEDLLPPKL